MVAFISLLVSVSAFGLAADQETASDDVALLIETLDHADRQVQLLAAGALGKFAPDATEAIAPLIQEFNDHATLDYREVARERIGLESSRQPIMTISAALGKFGANGLVPLTEALNDENESIVAGAMLSLAAMDRPCEKVVTALAGQLSRKEPFRRGVAAIALQQMRSAAREAALPLMRLATSDPDSDVEVLAQRAVFTIGPDERSVDVLIDRFEQDGNDSFAIGCLRQLGPKAASAVPTLVKALEKGDSTKISYIILALGSIGESAAVATPLIARRLSDADPDVRRHAARALGQIGPAAKEALPHLEKAIRLQRLLDVDQVSAGGAFRPRTFESSLEDAIKAIKSEEAQE